MLDEVLILMLRLQPKLEKLERKGLLTDKQKEILAYIREKLKAVELTG